jgi:diguanylate cyclase
MSADFAVGVDLSTGAFTRARFESELAKAVSVARRGKQTLSVIYLDVDDFTEHRDIHGADRAEELLSWMADEISRSVDGRGPLGRVEDDGFSLYLPAMTLTEACTLGERLRAQIAAVRHHGASGPFSVTVSVGVAALRKNEPWGNLLEAAENACRKAKQGGRDRMARR